MLINEHAEVNNTNLLGQWYNSGTIFQLMHRLSNCYISYLLLNICYLNYVSTISREYV